MAKYINKDALVAEIERRIKYDEMVMDHNAQITELLSRELNTLYELSSFIKSLEVKEVDLEKVFNDEYSKFSNDTDAMDYAFPIDLADYKDFAKHFFELGLSVSNKAQKGEKV